MADGKVLEFSNVTKVFGDVSAVSGLTAQIEPGVVTAVLGPNGAGKTTTLRILLGEIKPTSGTATIGGVAYARLAQPATVVGAVLETPAFRQRRTATRQLTSVAKANGIAATRVREVLDLVGLADVADMRIASFSLGMRQRLSVAQALLGDPSVLVFDEPANGMDPEGIRWMRLLMRRLADEGRTVLMSSHLLSEVQQVADRILIISNGTLVFSGGIEDLAGVDGPIVALDSPDREALVRILRERGYEFEVLRSGVNVRDTTARELGELAASAGIVLSTLHQRGPSLEDVFLDLVNGRTTRQTAALGPDDAQRAGRDGAGGGDGAPEGRELDAHDAGADAVDSSAADEHDAPDDDVPAADESSLAEGDAAGGVIAASAAVVTAGPGAAFAAEVARDPRADDTPAASGVDSADADADADADTDAEEAPSDGHAEGVDVSEAAVRATADAADASASEAFDAAGAESSTAGDDLPGTDATAEGEPSVDLDDADGDDAGVTTDARDAETGPDDAGSDDAAGSDEDAGSDDAASVDDHGDSAAGEPAALPVPVDRELPGAGAVAAMAAELSGDAADGDATDGEAADGDGGTTGDTDTDDTDTDGPEPADASAPRAVTDSDSDSSEDDHDQSDTDDTTDASAPDDDEPAAGPASGPWSVGPSFAERFGALSQDTSGADDSSSRYSAADAQDPAFTSLPATVPIDRVPGAREELAAGQDAETLDAGAADRESTTAPEPADEPEPTTQEIAFDSFTQAFQEEDADEQGPDAER